MPVRFRFPCRVALCAALLFNLPLAAQAQQGEPTNPLAVTHNMVNAWNRLDVDGIASIFSPDATYQSMMREPVSGRDAIRAHFARLLEGATHLELRLRNIAVTGNTVFVERIDEFTYKGKQGSVPVVAVLEIEDGLVVRWREYYDRADLLEAMGVEGY